VTRPELNVAAVTVSDRTCLQVLGVPWRALRAFAKERGIAIGKIGRRPVVVVADVLRALASEPAPVSDEDVIALATRRRAAARQP